jgi:hypothetical protein
MLVGSGLALSIGSGEEGLMVPVDPYTQPKFGRVQCCCCCCCYCCLMVIFVSATYKIYTKM